MQTPRDPLPALSRRTALHAGAAGLALASFPLRRVAAQETPATTELLSQWAAGWSNLGEPAVLLALLTDAIVYEDVAAGDLVEGIAGFERLLAEAHQGIPDFTITLDTAIVSEGHAAAEYQISGTQRGRLPYLSATGKPFILRAASIFVLDGDKIQRESRYYNMLSFLSQLGELAGDVLPPLGTPSAEPPA